MDISASSVSTAGVVNETIDRAASQPGSNLFLDFIFVGQLISLIIKSPSFLLSSSEYVVKNDSEHIAKMVHIVHWVTDGTDRFLLILNPGKQVVCELRISR